MLTEHPLCLSLPECCVSSLPFSPLLIQAGWDKNKERETMYKLDVQVDLREAAALERRRNMERQRQSRIFNARERTIGVSVCLYHWTISSLNDCYHQLINLSG